ncbi:MAG TPA: tetratricopeptide repeat protein [Flavobacteriaceae bacterium]|nr:tetratricopeptide repeat protein [Flavobacteriaceae bacterium]MCB9211890.1 tetratricopeptide repeat protein [Alteromonas sp.]HPF10016.1 tetratricopeptide repeat protein [Flavobacteriaceae bacterium]HQU22344.1 tetratricopeptide repeat protein [Flavobacteriaceae bacterium]HQU63901.1 tetratricopeptide repeat protein [Flavobacteriaceae bacterium]
MKRFRYILLFLWTFMSPSSFFAQEVEEANDGMGDVSDAFQEYFFEGLKQKSIENYELALAALQSAEKAAKEQPEQLAVVHFEMAKNYVKLKQYDLAEQNLKEVLQTQGERLDVMEILYDVYYEKKDYEAAIPLVEKLSKRDEDYKEDLANLYQRTKQYDKALELLDELDETWGESVYRNSLRKQIYTATGNTEGAIKNLESKIDKNPKNEQDYVNLIFLYSEEGNSQKAFETAQELLKQHPKSTKAHLALYKYYLEQGLVDESANSVRTILEASEITNEIKIKVLEDFLRAIQIPANYQSALGELTQVVIAQDKGSFYYLLGDFYRFHEDKELALSFFEKGTAIDTDNFNLLKNTLLLQIDRHEYEKAVALSEERLEVFPAQSLLYLLNGVAHTNLNEFNEAIESLESGLDFLLDNPKMERDFYDQLAKAYTLKGDSKKALEYQNKASQIEISN